MELEKRINVQLDPLYIVVSDPSYFWLVKVGSSGREVGSGYASHFFPSIGKLHLGKDLDYDMT